MNIKKFTIVFTACVAFLAVMFCNLNLISNKSKPPAWYANDPPQASDCGTPGCHGNSTTFDTTKFDLQMGTTQGTMTSVYNGVTTYVPGQTYYMSLTATGTSARYGFEVTAQYDSTDAGTLVDTFALLSGTTTTTLSSYNKATTANYLNASYYVGHKNASTTNSWTFQWTAPTAYNGPITFYYVGMYANGNGNNDAGDLVYNATKTITPVQNTNVGIRDISSTLSDLSTYPTLMSDHITVAFAMKEMADVRITLINLQGQTVKLLTAETIASGNFKHSYGVEGIAPGMYLVKVQIGDNYAISKVVKE
jgi:hypothetical protein